MNYTLNAANFRTLVELALEVQDCNLFTTSVRDLSIWDDYPPSREMLTDIWSVVNIGYPFIKTKIGKSNEWFAKRFFITLTSVNSWTSKTGKNKRNCPLATRLMMAQILGIIPIPKN